MTYVFLNILFCLSVAFGSQVLGYDSVGMSDLALSGAHDRPLRAAKRNHDLGRRDVKGCLSHDHRLHYVDGKVAHKALIPVLIPLP